MANLLLALIAFPRFHNTTIPTAQIAVSPANKLTPPPTPNLSSIGLVNNTAANANKLLARLFAAKIDAAYFG